MLILLRYDVFLTAVEEIEIDEIEIKIDDKICVKMPVLLFNMICTAIFVSMLDACLQAIKNYVRNDYAEPG